VVASEAAQRAHLRGTLVKSIGQLYAGKPHVQLEEGGAGSDAHGGIFRHCLPKGTAPAMALLKTNPTGLYSPGDRPEPIGQVPDRLLRTLVLLQDWRGSADLGLFARLGSTAKPSHIKVKLQGEDWKAAA